jgi:hypothetical protein
MNFAELIQLMFDVMKKAPSMTWSVEGGELVMRLPIPDESAQLLSDAQAMFA